jgi:hypothetical protein
MSVAASDVDDDAVRGGRVNPFAIVFQAGAGADGADDAVGGGLDPFGALDDVFEGEAHVAAALLEKAKGVGVAANGVVAGKVQFSIRIGEASPVVEGFFDGLTFRVGADGAEAFVAFGIDGGARGGFAPGSSALVHVRSPWGAKSAPIEASMSGGQELLTKPVKMVQLNHFYWYRVSFVGTGSTGAARKRTGCDGDSARKEGEWVIRRLCAAPRHAGR